MFNGHHQPHVPREFGYYDLRDKKVRRAQAKLASEFGIAAFCYYHYWFNGNMLLERPFNEVLSTGDPDFPFCLCWANENWTRRWDGKEHQILIAQNYIEYDPVQHIQWLERAFCDKRYVKVNRKPLLLLYKAGEIPRLNLVVKEWRNYVKHQGLEGLYICARLEDLKTNKRLTEAGIDSFYDFQPRLRQGTRTSLNLLVNFLSKVYNGELRITFPRMAPDLQLNKIFNYDKMVKRIVRTNFFNSNVIPCVFPSWDNTARRGNNSIIIQNNDAQIYKNWLKHAMESISQRCEEKQIVFINAWNEWAEGCHLEPDTRNGIAFLRATKEALDEYLTQLSHLNKRHEALI